MRANAYVLLFILSLLVACKGKETKPSPAATASSSTAAASATVAAQAWSPDKLAKMKRSIEGTVTLEGKTLHIKDAVAQWKPADRELAIEMLAYELDQAGFKTACTRTVFFADKPDAVPPWQWVPSSTLYVTFREDAKVFEPSTIKALRLNAYHMRKKNETVFIHRRGESIAKELTKLSGMTGPGVLVEFAFRGEDAERKASWDLKGRVPVCQKAK